MSSATIPSAQALFNSLPHGEKCLAIVAMFAGATVTFDPAARSGGELDYIVGEWLRHGNILPDAVALACAQIVAMRPPALPAAPPAPAMPAAPQPVQIAPQAAQIAPVAQPEPQPVQTPVAAAILTPAPKAFDAAAMPRLRSRVPARSLFLDQPEEVRDAIPAGLMAEYYAHADAPAVDPDYAFIGATLASALGAMAAGFNLWLHGPRATGKTEFSRQLAARTGRAFFRMNFNRGTDAEDILGGQAMRAGDTLTLPGPVALGAAVEGAIVLLDEPTYTVTAHLASLNPVLEKEGAPVRIPRSGEVLTIAPGVCFIAADNTAGSGSTSNEYHGRAPVGSDTLSRFAKFIFFDYLPQEVERRVLRARVLRACGVKPTKELARAVCKLVAFCRAEADTGRLEGAPCLRRAVAFCVSVVQGFDPAQAWTDCVVNAAPMDFQEAIRQAYAANWKHGIAPDAAADAADANPFADPVPAAVAADDIPF